VPGIDPAGPPQASQRVTLDQAWTTGWIVFCGRPVLDPGSFVASLRSVLGVATPDTAPLVWIDEPNLGPRGWRLQSLASAPAVGVSLETAGLSFRGGAGATAALTGTVATIQPGNSPGTLSNADGRTAPLSAPVTIQLTGTSAGCLETAVDLASPISPTGPVGAPATLADVLDIGLRYFYRQPGTDNAIGSERFSVFDFTQAATVGGLLRLDPLHPTDPERSALVFDPGTQLVTWFRSPLGEPVVVETTGDSRLVFARRPATTMTAGSDPVYAHPSGTFAVSFARERLLCGIAGNEYLDFDAEPPVRLDFVPGQPAYAPTFDPGRTPATGATDPTGATAAPGGAPAVPELQTVATTAWVRVVPQRRARYFSQPATASFYAFGGERPEVYQVGALPDEPQVVWYFPIEVGTTSTTGGVVALPLVPHAGVTGTGAAAQLEASVIQPARRAQIERAAAIPLTGPAVAPTVSVATPNGMIATFSTDGDQWYDVELGRTQDTSGQANPAGPEVLTLSSVGTDPALRSALLDSQQFLVISDPAVAARHLDPAHRSVTLGGWRFDLDPARWADDGTVLIVKHGNQAITQMLSDLAEWTGAAAFNTDPGQVQARLLSFVGDARLLAAAPGGEAYDRLVTDVLDAPTWNGTLVVNCAVQIPPDLDGLVSGLDPGRLLAHHLGVEQTPVSVDSSSGRLTPEHSSMFAAIRYRDDRPAPASGWQFTVRRLDVAFHNSVVTSLATTLELQLGDLFASPLVALDADGNPTGGPPVIELDGTHQNDGGVGRYLFVQDAPVRFAAQGALQGIRLDQVSFDSRPAGADGALDVRFSFWGALSFTVHHFTDGNQLAACDLFSFDELRFSGLGVDLRTTPGGAKSVAVDLSGLVLDQATSAVRPGSLLDRFPLHLVGLRHQAADTSPKALGYLPVTTPIGASSVQSDAWFGLECRLDLGSAGALGDIPALAASMLLAWSPGPQSFIGLRLGVPGTTGSASPVETAIQSVLKLKIGGTVLWPDRQTFLLLLTGVSLTLLGIALPPGGSTNIALFGDPLGGSTQLAWYGAWSTPAAVPPPPAATPKPPAAVPTSPTPH
jgi:hypothetical protein